MDALKTAAAELNTKLLAAGARSKVARITGNDEGFVEGVTASGARFSCMVVEEFEAFVVYVCHRGRGNVASAVTLDQAAEAVAGLPGRRAS
jgi:hypothetical protein